MFEQFNQKRSSVTKKIVLPGVGLLIIGGLLFLGNITEVAIAFVIIGVIVLIIGMSQLTSLTKGFKKQYLFEVLSSNFDNVSYTGGRGASREEVKQSELLPRSDRFYSNDLINATYNGIDFMMSDIHLQEVHRNGKNTTVRTIFKGPFMKFTFNKDFVGKLQVRERGFVSWFSKYEKMKMESIAFNKTFTTYSTDDHTAFYILTPHLMEQLIELERERRGVFYFSFINGEMFIALDNRSDSFELPVFSKVDESLGDRFQSEFQIIKDIIDELKLNKNIFK